MTRMFLLASAASLSLITPAVAQDISQASTWRGDEIIATGQKISGYDTNDAALSRVAVPLDQIAQSIQVLTPTLLQEQELSTLSDALTNVSGVVPSAPSEIVLANPVVRGFEAEIYVDGLLGYGDTAVIDPASLISVERIEVAKGPTSVLFGGGAGAPVGGLINVVTKSPEAESFARLGLRAGQFNILAPSADVNVALNDKFAVRLPIEYHTSDDAIDVVDIKRVTASPSARLQISGATEALVKLSYNRIEQLEYAGLPSAAAEIDGVDPFAFTGAVDAPPTTIENINLHTTLTHDFSDAWSATLQGRYFENSFREFAASPFLAFFPIQDTSAPIIKGQLPVDTKEWTFDGSVTGEFSTGPWDHVLLAGVTYDDTNYDGATGFDFSPIGLFDYTRPDNDLRFGEVPMLTNFVESDYKTLAAYAQDHISYDDRLHIMLGGRLSDYQLTEIEGGQGTDQSFTRLDPRVGVTYEMVDGVSAFAGWSTGSRLSLFFAGAEGAPPKLETSRSLEAGLKFNARDIGLSGTLGVFNITRQNVPTPDPATFITSIQTGEQRSQGFELDLIWEPSTQLSVLMSAAYTDSEVTEDTTIPIGDALPRVPDYSGRLAARYRFDGAFDGLGIGAGMTFADGAEITLPNSFRSDSYAVFDSQMSYEWATDSQSYRIGLSVQNLFNKRYFQPYQYFAQAVVRPAAPRSAFVTLSTKF